MIGLALVGELHIQRPHLLLRAIEPLHQLVVPDLLLLQLAGEDAVLPVEQLVVPGELFYLFEEVEIVFPCDVHSSMIIS